MMAGSEAPQPAGPVVLSGVEDPAVVETREMLAMILENQATIMNGIVALEDRIKNLEKKT